MENILATERGKDCPHFPYIPTWEERKNSEHKLTMRIRRFCYDFATSQPRRQNEWAEAYGVHIVTLSQWLQWKEVQDLIELYTRDHDSRIRQKFIQEEEGVIDAMVGLIKKTKFADVKRKAIVDFLGFAGRKNVNSGKVNIRQEQVQGQQQALGIVSSIDVSSMTDEDIDKELKEIAELEK